MKRNIKVALPCGNRITAYRGKKERVWTVEIRTRLAERMLTTFGMAITPEQVPALHALIDQLSQHTPGMKKGG